MKCPSCLKPMNFAEVCIENDVESKIAYACDTPNSICEVNIVYIVCLKERHKKRSITFLNYYEEP